MKKLITGLVIGALSSSAFATTWTVDDDGVDNPGADFSTIQEALDAALDGDEIEVFPGTYYELLTVTGKSLSLIGVAGREVTFIDGQDSGRVLEIEDCPSITIEGITIQRGRVALGDWSEAFGGGILGTNSSVYMNNCSILKNRVSSATYGVSKGAGVYLVGYGTSEFTSVYFGGNTFSYGTYGSGTGGAISSEQTNTVFEQCRFTSNSNTSINIGLHSILNSCFAEGNISGTYYLYNSVICGSPGTYIGFGNLFDCSDDGTIGACCAEEFGCDVISQWDCFQYAMHPRFGGPGSECDLSDCTTYDPFGSCCINGGCGFMRQSACDGIGGQWHGDYVTCAVVSCPQPPNMGACCVIEECFETIELSCTKLNGRWQGELTMCVDVDCSLPTPTGACCTNSTCLILTPQECFDALGNYAGDLTACKTTECTSNCLGDLTGNGLVDVNDILLLVSVWGACP
jgi:hypothetical protein